MITYIALNLNVSKHLLIYLVNILIYCLINYYSNIFGFIYNGPLGCLKASHDLMAVAEIKIKT